MEGLFTLFKENGAGLHPVFVHFPIALYVIALIFWHLAFIKRYRQLRKSSFLLVLCAVIGAGLAIISGRISSSIITHNDQIHELMEVHENLSYTVFAMFSIIWVWIFVRKHRLFGREIVIITILMWITMGLLLYQADIGGQMVFKHGAGTILIKRTSESHQQHNHHH